MGKRQIVGSSDAMTEFFDDAVEDAGVVAFDFDGTLTTRDSFTTFLRWRTTFARHKLGMARLAPAATSYLFDGNRGKLKAAAVREYLAGVPREQIEAEARTFAQDYAPRLLRPDALRTWRHWRQRRAKLVIVTASPDIVVAPFARGLGADALIATELAFDGSDRLTGGFNGDNCRGPEKVYRLRQVFGADLRLKAAYGDTSGDKDMMKIADHRGYRVFKEHP